MENKCDESVIRHQSAGFSDHCLQKGDRDVYTQLYRGYCQRPFCIRCFIIKVNEQGHSRLCAESGEKDPVSKLLSHKPKDLSLDPRDPRESQVLEDWRHRQANPGQSRVSYH